MKHGWEYKKLGEVCTLTMGQSPASESYNSESDGLPFFQGCSDFGKINPTIRIYCNAPTKIAEANDVLMSVRAPIGTLNIANVRCCIGRGLASFRATTKATNSYLYYFLKHSRNKLEALGTGSTFKAIGKDALFKFPIPIPPIKEQEEICSLLDKLSLVIEKKKQQVKELDNLAQAIFYDMFGDVNTNNHSYDIQTLSSVCEILTDGTHQTPEYTQDIVNGVKFLSAKDVVGGVINWNNIKYIPQSLHESLYSRLAPKRNDILLCKNGTTGIAAVVETDEIFDIYVSLALLRLKDGYLPKYILYAINNPTTKQQFDDSLKGVGVPNLHLGEIKKTRIVVPPLPLQQSFAQKIESIERQKELINQSIREAQTLFDSRMEYYFGE